jgi:hypothetical protein
MGLLDLTTTYTKKRCATLPNPTLVFISLFLLDNEVDLIQRDDDD